MFFILMAPDPGVCCCVYYLFLMADSLCGRINRYPTYRADTFLTFKYSTDTDIQYLLTLQINRKHIRESCLIGSPPLFIASKEDQWYGLCDTVQRLTFAQ
ncbi:hypothetical protein LY76DRAFT_415184 [Colletotrichum caudatum]|nr:hypothetical protein LY76DRAFT_415184 [Colletotrichum caudatum]